MHISRSFARTEETESFALEEICGVGEEPVDFGSAVGSGRGGGFAIAGNRSVVNQVLRAVGISLAA